jgi:type III secretion protein C
MLRNRCGLFAVFAIFCVTHVVPAVAAPIPFKQGHVNYDLQNEPLKDFLQRFFAAQDLQVVVSPFVESQGGTLNGPRNGTPEQVFRSIANSNQLSAYYDGSAVYVYKSNERITRYFAVPTAKMTDFVHAFQEMRLGDSSNTFSARGDTGLIMVSGAPRFVEQAQELTNALKQNSLAAPAEFRMFTLQYAWASDTTVTVGNHVVTVPGVATILRQLMYPVDQKSGTGDNREQVLRPVSTHLKGQGLIGTGNAGGAMAYNAPAREGLPPPLAPPPQTQAQANDGSEQAYAATPSIEVPTTRGARDARIVADPYRNAVIIRDAPDTMPLYAALVRELDVQPRIVEIEATIIDIDKKKLRDLGVDWRWKNGRTEALFGGDETVKQQFLRALGGNNIDLLPQQSAGLQLGAIIGNGSQFIARVNALADEGVTNVVSHPQVLTLNDVEAVIENTQTLYVPVSGAYEVDLFNVVAGTTLRVTPHLVVEPDRERIRLLISIEDGDVQISATTTNGTTVNYPTVTRSAVNTQAIIDQGQSLLLGGLVRNASGYQTNKTPFLGDIPVLGYLFKREQKDRERTERLFLISPRLLALNHITGQTPGTSDPHVTVDDLDAQDALENQWWRKHSSDPPPPPPVVTPIPPAQH